MARPTDWHPLAEADPIPGVVVGVTAEADRLKTVAGTIRDQITRLNKIGSASDADLKAEAGKTIRQTANDLAGKLTKTAARYEAVSGHLRGWAGELDWSQTESAAALTDAQLAQAKINTHAAPVYDPKTTPAPTPAQQRDEATRVRLLNQADADLTAAKARLDRAVQHRDQKGRDYKNLIEGDSHDGLKDSDWDSFKDWVDSNKGWLTALADIAGWIATALAVVALFVSGGWILVLLIAVTAAAFICHTLLAAAGDGSWISVGLDLLSFCFVFKGVAVAAKMGKAAEAAQTALKKAAPTLGAVAKQEAWTVTKATRSELGRIIATSVKGSPEYEAACKALSVSMKGVHATASAAEAEALRLATNPIEEIGGLKALLHGGPEAAGRQNLFSQITSTFSGAGSSALDVAKLGLGHVKVGRILIGASGGIDITNHIFGGSWTLNTLRCSRPVELERLEHLQQPDHCRDTDSLVTRPSGSGRRTMTSETGL